MTQSNPTRNQDAMLEELVAYLDGELDHTESERIEKKLSQDADYRTRLKELQHTWDMLDHLPRGQVGDAFTQTTIEMAAVKATDDTAQRQGALRIRQTIGWLAVVAAGMLAILVGYGVVHQRLDEPNRQLLEDLPVVENVDLYYHAEDIEFLEQLADSGVFDEELESVDYAQLPEE
jgi:anti-sigma factor RsiW